MELVSHRIVLRIELVNAYKRLKTTHGILKEILVTAVTYTYF